MLKIIAILATVLLVSVANADCIIGLTWTPDPAQSAVTEQEVWYNPDGVVDNGDEVLKHDALAADVNQAEFTETGDCLTGHAVYVVTKYIGSIEKKSAEVQPTSVVGAILNLAVQDQQ